MLFKTSAQGIIGHGISKIIALEDFKVLALCYGFLRIWDMEKLIVLKELRLGGYGKCMLQIGNTIICGLEYNIYLIDIVSLTVVNKIESGANMIICLDNNLIITCWSKDNLITLWKFTDDDKDTNMKLLKEVKGDNKEFSFFTNIHYNLNNDNNLYFATGDSKGQCAIWSVDKTSYKIEILRTFQGGSKPITISYMLNSKFNNDILIVGSCFYNELNFWSLKNNEILNSIILPIHNETGSNSVFNLFERDESIVVGVRGGDIVEYSLVDFSMLYRMNIHPGAISKSIAKSK